MLQVKLHSIKNATEEGEALANRAVALMQEIVNDRRFLSQVRSARFSYTARMLDSGEDAPSTDNDTIVHILSGGKEVTRQPDGVIDLTVVIRKFNWLYRKTMGSVTPPNPTISTNRRFFDAWVADDDVVTVAAHWLHEWMHAAGFYHATDSGDSDDVPYAVGEIAVRIGQSMAGAPHAEAVARVAPGAGYLEAARDHACPVTAAGVPDAELFDDSDDADGDDEERADS